MRSVRVLFDNDNFSYQTSISANSTAKSLSEYFLGKMFNIANYPIENMAKCTRVEFEGNFYTV